MCVESTGYSRAAAGAESLPAAEDEHERDDGGDDEQDDDDQRRHVAVVAARVFLGSGLRYGSVTLPTHHYCRHRRWISFKHNIK